MPIKSALVATELVLLLTVLSWAWLVALELQTMQKEKYHDENIKKGWVLLYCFGPWHCLSILRDGASSAAQTFIGLTSYGSAF